MAAAPKKPRTEAPKPARKAGKPKAPERVAAAAPQEPAAEAAPGPAKKGRAKPAAKVPAKKAAPAKPSAKKPSPAKGKKAAAKPPAAPTAVPATEAPEDPDPLCGLTAQEALVVEHYLVSYNQTQAYMDAGYQVSSRESARASASRLLTSVNGQRYRAKRMKEMLQRNEDAQDRMLALWLDMAYADARELSEMRVGCCRHCWGTDHEYQRTPVEWRHHEAEHQAAVAKAKEKGEPEPVFKEEGGSGFLKTREPNPECPECGGEGKERVVFKDTANLSPGAVALFAGAEIGKDGTKVKIHDQRAARETLAKIFKLFDDRPAVEINFNAAELEATYGEIMAASHERMAKMRAERLATRDEREG